MYCDIKPGMKNMDIGGLSGHSLFGMPDDREVLTKQINATEMLVSYVLLPVTFRVFPITSP